MNPLSKFALECKTRFANATPEQKRWVERAVWLVLVLLAFVAGRFTAPEPSVQFIETEKFVFQYAEDTHAKDTVEIREVEKIVWKQAGTKTITEYRNIKTDCPDGGSTVDTSVIVTKETNEASGGTDKTKDTDRTTEVDTKIAVDLTKETRKETVPVLPDWRVGVAAGYSFVKPPLDLTGGLVIGASVEFRVPLQKLGVNPRNQAWVGLTAGTYGAALVTAHVTF